MEVQVSIIGGGLAGSECALSLARRGIPVKLYEMRPDHQTPVHKTGLLAELVCSNSLKSMRQDSAAGLLKRELSLMGSEILDYALKARVPAGGALAVDRLIFSQLVSEAVEVSPEIELVREEVTEVRGGPAVIAAGPLCSEALFDWLSQQLGSEGLSFLTQLRPSSMLPLLIERISLSSHAMQKTLAEIILTAQWIALPMKPSFPHLCQPNVSRPEISRKKSSFLLASPLRR